MSAMTRTSLMTGTVVMLAFAVVAVPSHAMQDEGAAKTAAVATMPASILVFDQKLDTKSIKLSYVYVPEKSVAVVYSDGAEKKQPLGSLAVAPGDHRDLKIALANEPEKGSKLWVSLYRDKDGKAEPKADQAYWSADKLPTESGFTVQ